jgi:hypothetical protein
MKPRLPRHEKVNDHPIICYDNGGRSFDRYTTMFLHITGWRHGEFCYLAMSERPFHPQGFGQHGYGCVGRHLGKRIPFSTLPPDCQKAVLQDLKTT